MSRRKYRQTGNALPVATLPVATLHLPTGCALSWQDVMCRRTPTPAPRTGAVKGEETTTEVQKRMAQEHTAEPSDVLPNVLDQTIETVTPLKLTPPTSELGTPEIMLTLPCGTWPDATRQKVLRTAVAISGFIIMGGFIVLGSIAWTVLMGVGCLVMIDVYIQVSARTHCHATSL